MYLRAPHRRSMLGPVAAAPRSPPRARAAAAAVVVVVVAGPQVKSAAQLRLGRRPCPLRDLRSASLRRQRRQMPALESLRLMPMLRGVWVRGCRMSFLAFLFLFRSQEWREEGGRKYEYEY